MKYKITDVRQRTKEEKGKREIVMRILYETETGFTGSVDIAKDKFSEQEARKAIEKEIKEMLKLQKEKEVRI